MAVVGDGDGAPSGFGSGSAAWKERARGVEVVAVGGARTTASCDAATGASAAVGGEEARSEGGVAPGRRAFKPDPDWIGERESGGASGGRWG